MRDERSKRKEEMLWEKAVEIWKDWKVTISILLFFSLATIGLMIFAIINWNTGFWRGGGFSGEVDAAMINSLLSAFVTVPITLFTGAGTILVTVYFNLQTQKIAVQAQRSALRDKLLEKRMDIYPRLREYAFQLVQLRSQMLKYPLEHRTFIEERKISYQMARFMWEHKPFISDSVWKKASQICYEFLSQEEIRELNIPFVIKERTLSIQSLEGYRAELRNMYFALYRLLKEELNFETHDQDWEELRRR